MIEASPFSRASSVFTAESGAGMSVKIGLVIPVVQTKFVLALVKKLLKGCRRTDLAICIVNDGKEEVVKYMAGRKLPAQVHLLDLPENLRFAGANNAGWRHLIKLYPSLAYLGTINDDTVPAPGCVEEMVSRLEEHPRTAVAMPVMLVGNRFFPKSYAVWKLGDAEVPLVPLHHKITSDAFTSVINGFCFMAAREALEEVGFFDERYSNSCEDVDLALKLLTCNWRIIVSKKTKVYHHEAQSRYLVGSGTDLDASHQLLLEKWGRDLSRYNNLNANGFLIHDPE